MSDDLTQDLYRALAEAYVQTGTQHLDLTMVIKGKNMLKTASEQNVKSAPMSEENPS